MIPTWIHELGAGLLFAACVALPAAIPLTAPRQNTERKHTGPAWARTRAGGRRYARTHSRKQP
ncbi:hypothetical protein ACUXZZ_45255 (plasmid) [Streptomyces graminifolii]|uniref:hypothetical protein n=1 Tax=Streptomyces graminifolii TaxID=1266771 RepID=UPI004059C70B